VRGGNGILIITAPNPLFDKIATTTGYLRGEEHVGTFTINKITRILERNNFEVVYSKYFMFCPLFRFPLEDSIESLLRSIRLGKLMTNQLVVGGKGNH
jgi:hypothetical protein